MSKYTYQVTVERIGDPDSQGSLSFRTESHDDILQLAARLGKTEDADLSFLVGLKLFGEALLANKDDQAFRELRPHFGAFMKSLKARGSRTP